MASRSKLRDSPRLTISLIRGSLIPAALAISYCLRPSLRIAIISMGYKIFYASVASVAHGA